MRVLKHLAVSRGRTIVLTIHSPSSKIFALFDRLLLLTPTPLGARIAYQGAAKEVLSYFEGKLNWGLERVAAALNRSATHMTIADFLMALLHNRRNHASAPQAKAIPAVSAPADAAPLSSPAALADAADKAAAEADEERIHRVVSAYLLEPDRLPEELLADINDEQQAHHQGGGRKLLSLSGGGGPLHPGSSASLSWLQQFRHLVSRSYVSQRRVLGPLRMRLFTNVFLSLFVGLLYLNTDQRPVAVNTNFNQTAIFNRVGFLFFITCMQALITLMAAVLTCQTRTTIHQR